MFCNRKIKAQGRKAKLSYKPETGGVSVKSVSAKAIWIGYLSKGKICTQTKTVFNRQLKILI